MTGTYPPHHLTPLGQRLWVWMPQWLRAAGRSVDTPRWEVSLGGGGDFGRDQIPAHRRIMTSQERSKYLERRRSFASPPPQQSAPDTETAVAIKTKQE